MRRSPRRKKSFARRFFKKLFLGLLLVAALIGLIYMSAGMILEKAVPFFVPRITQTNASLAEADISLFRGNISLSGLKIANPSHFAGESLFEMKHISVSFDPLSLFANTILIHEILIDGTKIDAEINSSGDINLLVLNKNIQQFLAQPKPVEKPSSASMSEKPAKNLVIQNLMIQNSELSLGVAGQLLTLDLPDIRKKNIGEKQQNEAGKILAEILSVFTQESLTAIANSTHELIKGKLGDLSAWTGKGIQSLKQTTEKATDSLSGLKELFH